jgi:chorismate-pyruvate lyase
VEDKIEKRAAQSDLKQVQRDFLERLIARYYPQSAQIGVFTAVAPAQLPEPYGVLLAHDRHMTVTVESFHHSPVDVEVLRSHKQGDDYSREILLKTQLQGRVVQYGIVGLHLQTIAADPQREILQEDKPLGRILIEHDVLRVVELLHVWHVQCGPVLSRWFNVPETSTTYGRTAIIHCDGEPAIELLEIVCPAHPSSD